MVTGSRTRLGLADSVDDADESRWSMFVAGDYVIDRDEPATAERTIDPALRDRIAAAEVSIVNFEAPIVDGAEPITKSGPVIENPPEAATAAADAGFDVCALANNHVRDYGPEGVASTLEALQRAGCETVGVGESHDAAFEPLEVTRGDGRVAVVNVCEREFNIAGEDSYGAAWISDRRARETIRRADREYDAVIVLAHGGAEYVPFPSPELQGTLREFVDLGADLVVGHHPHVPQGWERYGDGAIFYSLGNFLFDRMADSENCSWGLSLEIEFDGATPVGVDLVPTETIDGTAYELGERRDRENHLEYLHRLAELTAEPSTLEPYWQEVAVQVFYERYSNWLHMGCGATLARARSAPNDPEAQRPVWDPEARRREIMALLTIVRTESHRWLMTTALSVLTGEVADRRTPAIREEAQLLLSRAER
ncbi:CapA family protein [Natrononativus amylolyticus]|uniref:CapA family protein n=1 Tax=Natrononativus amylolyticus TaxID=2963434 RepID=UPI0020CD5BFD|nr:CapA family protein [Natrononativus amylolyticus]